MSTEEWDIHPGPGVKILQRIFDFLDLDSLKTARQVCQPWATEGGTKFSNMDVVIWLSEQKQALETETSKLEDLAKFVSRYNIAHTLGLSFLNPCWYEGLPGPGRDEVEVPSEYYPYFYHDNAKQRSRSEGGFASKILNYFELESATDFVCELRLEITLVNSEDSELLSKVLSRLPTLEILSLDIAVWEDEGILCFPQIPHNILTLGLYIHKGEKIQHSEKELSPSCCLHLMTVLATSSIKFLDFATWPRAGLEQDWHYTNLCLEAMSSLRCQNPQAFPNLSGLRLSHLGRVPLEFSIPFSHLYNILCEHGRPTLRDAQEQYEQILRTSSQSITVLDIIWRGSSILTREFDSHFVVSINQLITLPHMPRLKIIRLTNTGDLLANDLDIGNWQGLASFNFREIFLGGSENLRQLLPSLTTLCVLFFRMDGQEIWQYTFPSMDNCGNQVEIRQIKSLTISLNAECDSGNCAFEQNIPKA